MYIQLILKRVQNLLICPDKPLPCRHKRLKMKIICKRGYSNISKDSQPVQTDFIHYAPATLDTCLTLILLLLFYIRKREEFSKEQNCFKMLMC
jgi:hypothetical protein